MVSLPYLTYLTTLASTHGISTITIDRLYTWYCHHYSWLPLQIVLPPSLLRMCLCTWYCPHRSFIYAFAHHIAPPYLSSSVSLFFFPLLFLLVVCFPLWRYSHNHYFLAPSCLTYLFTQIMFLPLRISFLSSLSFHHHCSWLLCVWCFIDHACSIDLQFGVTHYSTLSNGCASPM